MAQIAWMADLFGGNPQETPLLDTKLHIPRMRPGMVPRARLVHMLDGALNCRLTIISAPPGFGKTTLVASWLACSASGTPVAWVSLDEGENDPGRFWAYILAALERVSPGVTRETATQISSGGPVPVESMLTAILNSMARTNRDMILVLDDYQAITTPGVHQAMTFLVEHLPPTIHVVVISRTEPPFSLSRMRVLGELLEFHAADLRFTEDEASQFLESSIGPILSASDVHDLVSQTEGWAAALQLAGLSLRGNPNPSDVIRSLSGSSRLIADYLTEEVFRRQSRDVQQFLLGTSILSRVNAGLCQDLVPGVDCEALLAMMERANLFLEPLDEERTWYKYHHVFASFLRSRLEKSDPARVLSLHAKAAEWHLTRGFTREAIEHAISAERFDLASSLIEPVARSMFMRTEVSTLLRWLTALPRQALLASPEVSIVGMWCYLTINRLDRAEQLLDDFERHTSISADALLGSGVDDLPENAQRILVEIAAVKASVLLVHGRLNRVIDMCRVALTRPGSQNDFLRGVLNRTLGVAMGHMGDALAADKVLAEAQSVSEATGNALVEMAVLESIAQLYSMQGHLSRAEGVYRQVIATESSDEDSSAPVTGFAHVRLGRILYYWNRLDEAERELATGAHKCKLFGSNDTSALAHVALARISVARGDLVTARRRFHEAEDLVESHNTPRALSFMRLERARFNLIEGNPSAAVVWANGVSFDGMSDEVAESNSIMLARVRLAQRKPLDALDTLKPWREAAEKAGRVMRLLEILLLEALAWDALGESAHAQESLLRALELGCPNGIIRPFIDEGEPIVVMINRLTHLTEPTGQLPIEMIDYIRTLDEAAQEKPQPSVPETLHPGHERVGALRSIDAVTQKPVQHVRRPATLLAPDIRPTLIDPLSERELEVLGHILAGMSNKEIASEMNLAVTTIKWHVKNVFSKLEVKSRTQALSRARELGLIDS